MLDYSGVCNLPELNASYLINVFQWGRNHFGMIFCLSYLGYIQLRSQTNDGIHNVWKVYEMIVLTYCLTIHYCLAHYIT